MNTDGRFERVVIDDRDTREWEISEIPFYQNGLSFAFFIDLDEYPLVDIGREASGYIDGVERARGDITSVSPITRDNDDMLRVNAAPTVEVYRESEDLLE